LSVNIEIFESQKKSKAETKVTNYESIKLILKGRLKVREARLRTMESKINQGSLTLLDFSTLVMNERTPKEQSTTVL